MTYIFKNLTKNKIRALIYILTDNPRFSKDRKINPLTIISNDNDFYKKMQVMNHRNEYSYLLGIEDDNTIRITRDESLISLSYDISSLHLVVEEYDYILRSIRFEDAKGNRIGLWVQKVEPVKGDLNNFEFTNYVELFADEVIR